MLLKALSQRIDRGRLGPQTGGGHARERADRPSSSPLTRGAVFSMQDESIDLKVDLLLVFHLIHI